MSHANNPEQIIRNSQCVDSIFEIFCENVTNGIIDEIHAWFGAFSVALNSSSIPLYSVTQSV